MSNIASLPYLVQGQTYALRHQFPPGTISGGSPTWTLFVDGAQVASGPGQLLDVNRYTFPVAVPVDAAIGKSAQIELATTIDAQPVLDVYNSAIGGTVKLIEIDKEYVHAQQSEDKDNRTANVTIREPTP